MLNKLQSTVDELKNKQPLVLCLTNFVTAQFVANSLLAAGAAPLMSNDAREHEELVPLSQAVVVNIGTLDDYFINNSMHAVECCRRYNVPIVLDPVGAGASQLRTGIARQLLPNASVVRANASEVEALLDDAAHTKGVETTQTVNHATHCAYELARFHQATVVVSGATDLITDGERGFHVNHGSPWMAAITGMGCALSAMCAAFIGTSEDKFAACVDATTYYGLCGDNAAKQSRGPGSFRHVFLDELAQPDLATQQLD
jgi:hydroxyethylthiazole kinase